MNTDALRQLYTTNRCAKALLENCANRKNNVNTTPVDRLLDLLAQEQKAVVTRRELVDVLRALEEIGCGRFVIGRRGQQSRFEWGEPIVQVGKAVVAPVADAVVPRSETSRDGDGTTSAMETINHVHQLRPGFAVRLELPTDLSTKEAHRLAEFVRTLPFDFDTQERSHP